MRLMIHCMYRRFARSVLLARLLAIRPNWDTDRVLSFPSPGPSGTMRWIHPPRQGRNSPVSADTCSDLDTYVSETISTCTVARAISSEMGPIRLSLYGDHSRPYLSDVLLPLRHRPPSLNQTPTSVLCTLPCAWFRPSN